MAGVTDLKGREKKTNVVVRADDKSRHYGDDNPPFTFTITPRRHDLEFEGKCSADAKSPVNDYDILPELVGTNEAIREIEERYHIKREKGTLTVTCRRITVTATADTRIYDSTNNSSPTPTITSGKLADGDVGTFTQTFDSRNAGNRTLNAAASIQDATTGRDVTASYNIHFVPVGGTITRRPITVTATADTKTYDGTYNSTATPTITSGSLAGDDSAALTQTFDGPNTSNRTLTPSASINDGNSGNNYSVTPLINSGTIQAATPTVAVTGATFATLGVDNKPVAGSFSLARPEVPPPAQAGAIPDRVIVKFTSTDENYTNPAPSEVDIPAPALRDITGVIKSRTGVVVANYKVQLLDLVTGDTVETQTDANGIYHFHGGVGPYDLIIGTKRVPVPNPGTGPSNQAGA